MTAEAIGEDREANGLVNGSSNPSDTMNETECQLN
jgi:hypothetical protein